MVVWPRKLWLTDSLIVFQVKRNFFYKCRSTRKNFKQHRGKRIWRIRLFLNLKQRSIMISNCTFCDTDVFINYNVITSRWQTIGVFFKTTLTTMVTAKLMLLDFCWILGDFTGLSLSCVQERLAIDLYIAMVSWSWPIHRQQVPWMCNTTTQLFLKRYRHNKSKILWK